MKSTFKVLSAIIVIAIMIVSCSKKEQHDDITKDNQVVFRNSTALNAIQVDNGVPVFSSPQHYRNAIAELRQMDVDPISKESDYTAMGLSALDRESDIHYTDCPSCRLFEQSKGYNSLFSRLEDAIFVGLDNGEDLSYIITLTYAKTLMNSDGVLKVGTRYFKLYDNDLFVIIGNDDRSKLDEINALLPHQVSSDYNVRLTSKFEEKEDLFYILDENSLPNAAKDVVDFKISQNVLSDGKIQIENISFIEYIDGSQAEYKWIYSDGSYFVGKNPNRSFNAGDSLEVEYGNENNGRDNYTITSRECPPPVIDMVKIGNNTFRFSTQDYTSSSGGTFQWTWTFNDGTTANGQSVTHEFPCGQSFIVSVLITYPRGDQCPGEIEFETPPCNCNKFGTDTDEQTFPVGSDAWRIDCKIWIDRLPWFTTGDVGSRSISRRKGTFGRFYKRNVDEICASLGGHYLRKPDCNQIFPGIEECEINRGNVQRNVNDNAARKDPGMLFSRHRMVVKGVPCVFSKNGGRLVLK